MSRADPTVLYQSPTQLLHSTNPMNSRNSIKDTVLKKKLEEVMSNVKG